VSNAVAINGSSPTGNLTFSGGTAYNENTQHYQAAMQDLVDEGYYPTIPRSSNNKDYFYLIGDDGEGVMGAILTSDKSLETENGCYFSDSDYGCSGAARSYVFEYDRDSLIENADECSVGSCGGVSKSSPAAEVVADTIVVEGAGYTAANGLYTKTGTVNGKNSYSNNDVSGVGLNWYAPVYMPTSSWGWQISLIGGGASYESTGNDDVVTPDLVSGWERVQGTNPAPTVRQALTSDL